MDCAVYLLQYAHHKHVQELYKELLKDVKGITLHEQPADSRYDSNFWLCAATIDPEVRIKGQENAYKEVTKTAMGARCMRQYIEQPLIDKEQIERRLDAVEALCVNPMVRDEIREYLNPVYDLERLLSKVSFKTANPRDMIAFRNSLKMLPHIKTVLKDFEKGLLSEINDSIDGLSDICALIDSSIIEDPPISIRDGGIIKDGFDETIDNLRHAKTEGKNWLMQLEKIDKK